MKGVSEDVYQSLLVKDISCISDFIKEFQCIEEMNQRHIAKHQFTRLSNVVPVASIGEHEDLVTIIRHFVRESIAVSRRNKPPRRPRTYATVVRQPRRPVEPLPVPRHTDMLIK
ncbi:CCHC-type domain-containing protein [Trichonephila clavipes]|nr:CCHC-type domain-containing protein [Trichonephila clavipes]